MQKRFQWNGETIWEQVNERERTQLLTRNYVHDLREFALRLNVVFRVGSILEAT